MPPQVCEVTAQFFASRVDVSADGDRPAPQDFGDLLGFELLELLEDETGFLLESEPSQANSQPVLDLGFLKEIAGFAGAPEFGQRLPEPAPPKMISGGIDSDPVDPRSDFARVLDLGHSIEDRRCGLPGKRSESRP